MSPLRLNVVVATLALLVAGISSVVAVGSSDDSVAASANPLAGARASSPGLEAFADPVLLVDVSPIDGIHVLPGTERIATTDEMSGGEASAATDPSSTEAGSTAEPEEPASASKPAEKTEREPERNRDEPPSLGDVKSKANDKGYDVHGHVEHSVILLGQQVLIPGQAATGGFIQTSETKYMAYSPITAMLPVAIQDNKEVLAKKPDLDGERLHRRLAQEYTGSNDYRKLDPDAQRAINILTCTDWSLVDKRVRENTINHLLHSPISFGTIGSVDDPISTDVTIDLGYTHTRDKNWTEVEYMGDNVYKITVVSNNNNGSHTGHEMGTAYVEMPAGTSLREARKIGNQMIPSKNKNNKLTLDTAARELFETLPRGASPMILFSHLSEAEQNAYFEGRGIESVGKPNPDCNPLDGGILGSTAGPADPAPEAPAAEEVPTDEQPADGQAPAEQAPAEQAPADGTPTDGQTPPADGSSDEAPSEPETPPGEPETPPAEPADGTDPSSDSG